MPPSVSTVNEEMANTAPSVGTASQEMPGLAPYDAQETGIFSQELPGLQPYVCQQTPRPKLTSSSKQNPTPRWSPRIVLKKGRKTPQKRPKKTPVKTSTAPKKTPVKTSTAPTEVELSPVSKMLKADEPKMYRGKKSKDGVVKKSRKRLQAVHLTSPEAIASKKEEEQEKKRKLEDKEERQKTAQQKKAQKASVAVEKARLTLEKAEQKKKLMEALELVKIEKQRKTKQDGKKKVRTVAAVGQKGKGKKQVLSEPDRGDVDQDTETNRGLFFY